MIDDKKILVTGATGFVGSYLVRLLLQKGYKVRGLMRSNSKFDLLSDIKEHVEWVNVDVTDVVGLEDAMEGIKYVCHCAASISFHPKDIREMHKTNVGGTANVVNLCLHHNVEKLIHVSSIAALGRSKDRLVLDEKCQWIQSRLNSNYAITKHLAEQEVWRGVAEGLPAIIVSPSVVVGSRSWEDGMSGFFKKIDKGLKLYPSGQSGFVDVRDVVVFMEMMLQSDISAERFILNAVNIPHREFFNQIAVALKASPPSIQVGPYLAEIAWRVEWLKEKLLGATPLLTKESARASVSKFRYQNEKSLAVPGFQYRPFEQTVLETARQYKEAKKDGFSPRVLPFEAFA